jgi:hypothetical protein
MPGSNDLRDAGHRPLVEEVPAMRYQTRIVGDAVEVTSSHTGTVYTYTITPGISPGGYALRCAERARVSECLGHHPDWRPPQR